ncbi:helix-turn-helix domain-containing protein [Actinocatenispora rupis]|uniref:HxlR family transcriptional regulator n=2 Tax=Actinocatenispora rupis TaxID=519421 RepID=A0A8J3JCI7_9ACTN|nr:HxlR family transcriptional regulator [Actinocatenispora rupis]
MDVLGGRWTVVILAHLKEGVHRYGELRRRMPDITEKMLTQRLRELERAGLVERTPHGGAAADDARPWLGVSYDLTDEGRGLKPVLQALYDWGAARADRYALPVDPVS